MAVDALARLVIATTSRPAPAAPAGVREAALNGAAWLIEHTAGGTRFEPSPIGLYFAKLWYFEKLYPIVFTVSALNRVRRMMGNTKELPQRR